MQQEALLRVALPMRRQFSLLPKYIAPFLRFSNYSRLSFVRRLAWCHGSGSYLLLFHAQNCKACLAPCPHKLRTSRVYNCVFVYIAGLMRARPHTRARAMASSSDRDAKGGASRKGDSYEQKTRRRGRPAWMRSPYDSPLRDGNRDRLVGLLTGKTSVTKNPEVTCERPRSRLVMRSYRLFGVIFAA